MNTLDPQQPVTFADREVIHIGAPRDDDPLAPSWVEAILAAEVATWSTGDSD